MHLQFSFQDEGTEEIGPAGKDEHPGLESRCEAHAPFQSSRNQERQEEGAFLQFQVWPFEF